MNRTEGERIRVVIADDHRSFGEALQIALDKEQDLAVIEIVTDGQEAVRAATRAHPDVVLMDLQMPDLDGPGAIATLREQAPEVRVLVLTTYGTDADITRAVDAGATGYLLKDAPASSCSPPSARPPGASRCCPPRSPPGAGPDASVIRA
jgi:DNA-binding NarL/FixJ family response regulator